MKTRILRATWLAALAVAAFAGVPAQAQVSMGADVVSRYVWRGVDFGDSWAIQPALSFAGGGFEVGAWASYGTQGANESDLYVSYTAETESGAAFSLGLNNYFFPGPGADFTDLGDHAWEPFISFSGPESFPLELLVGVVDAEVEGKDETTAYVELGAPFSKGGADLRVHIGVVGGDSGFYGVTGASVTTLGIAASKPIAVGESFEIPVALSYVVNPDAGVSFLIFGVTLSP